MCILVASALAPSSCCGPHAGTDPPAQVRFGVLNAGNFGVSQSRKRTFIWGAAPGEALPDWPKLMHVFRSPQLTIRLPGGVTYTAVPQVRAKLQVSQRLGPTLVFHPELKFAPARAALPRCCSASVP